VRSEVPKSWIADRNLPADIAPTGLDQELGFMATCLELETIQDGRRIQDTYTAGVTNAIWCERNYAPPEDARVR